MDMLRYHLFEGGNAWMNEYGTSDDFEQFQILQKYSPLHNINANTPKEYPAVLMLTGQHDNRVLPLHSYKMIATLQKAFGHLSQQKNPLLLRVEAKGGHGADKPLSILVRLYLNFKNFYCKKNFYNLLLFIYFQIEEYTDILTFVHKALKLEFKKNIDKNKL